ncbi:unnamed protein product [Ranitomeya imitator]|uniref:Calpain catalytic domain-containing protein n=1 Tax=Ranitomeya imitator TaxID=111125 RepID=A0ABN9M5Z3_9NEOB|nr:unnamed protein product [Ranitomeya imitator]
MCEQSLRTFRSRHSWRLYQIKMVQNRNPERPAPIFPKKVQRAFRLQFAVPPRGRVPGRQSIVNCHLSGCVNKQNMRYWSETNPREVHERPLHSDRVTVWCAISRVGIIGPYFFQDNGRTKTVNSERLQSPYTQKPGTMAGVAAKLAKDRATALGIGANKTPKKYLNQDFEELRAQCLASGTLFEDPTFPAAWSSLGFKDLGPNSVKVQGLEWKRPSKIKPNPQFINEGASRADVRQGSLGDCWFLCSIASLTLNDDCLCRVVPVDQSFDINYAGIFHFKFWQYGEWVDVVVDDRLPTKKSKLLFVKSTTANEFWSALLEKAYAKVNGSYEALAGGVPLEALEDFTGGIGELYYFDSAPPTLFQIIQTALRKRSLLTCSTKSDSGTGEIVVSTNVVKNHAYSLTGAEEIPYRGDTVQIVRVRNPWGYKEWNGAWSDRAPEWDVDPRIKADLKTDCDDGETWKAWSDYWGKVTWPFCNYKGMRGPAVNTGGGCCFPSFLVEFFRVEICHLNLDNVSYKGKHQWCLTEFTGSWAAGCTAGGCKGNPTFWTNPQFLITLEEPDDDGAEGTDTSLSTVIVSLMQKERRRKKPEGGSLYNIGFYIYQVSGVIHWHIQ